MCNSCGASRTRDSRGFAFVRYKYADEAQKAVEKLDGKDLILFLFYMIDTFLENSLNFKNLLQIQWISFS